MDITASAIREEITNALAPLREQMGKHEKKLDRIGDALETLAVQQARLGSVETKTETLFAKYNSLIDPRNGVITSIQTHQASCPRSQIKVLWSIMIPVCLLVLSVAGLVLRLTFGSG